ncbi:MAG: MATE family efflux transporter, partial [Spirochaetes bacterium]|nr:MATE family efflux transporter [Spirochaetota bacterium]
VFVMALANGIVIGVNSLVARAIGERNHRILEKAAESGLVIGIFFGIALLILGYLYDRDIIATLGASELYMTRALDYYRFILPLVPVILFGAVFQGILQGEGLMKYVMKAMIIATVLNIVLDPVFIFLLDLKVKGAALATCLSHSTGVFYTLSVFHMKKSSIHVKWKLANIDLHTMGKISSIGFTQAASMIIMSLSFMFINRIVIHIDKLAMTAYSLAARIDQIIFIPIFAIGSAVLTMVGQNSARGLYDRTKEIWYRGIQGAAIMVLFLAAVMFILARIIYSNFSEIDQVVNYAVTQTRILAFTYIFATVGILGRSVFQGTGHPFPALVLAFLRMIILNVPAILVLVYVFNLKMYGVWFGLIIGNSTTAIISLIWVRSSLNKLKSGELKVIPT